MHAISTQREFLGYMGLVLPPTEASAGCPSLVLDLREGSPHWGKPLMPQSMRDQVCVPNVEESNCWSNGAAG